MKAFPIFVSSSGQSCSVSSGRPIGSPPWSTRETGPLTTIVTETTRHLQLLMSNVSEAQIAAVVDKILRANRIILYGEGAPGCLTALGERRLFDRIFQAGSGDLAVVFAFRRVNREAMAVLEHLKAEGGETVLITDLPNSRMHPLADQALLVQRGPMEAFRPLGAALAVMDALILGVMLAKGDDAVDQLGRLDALRQRYDWL